MSEDMPRLFNMLDDIWLLDRSIMFLYFMLGVISCWPNMLRFIMLEVISWPIMLECICCLPIMLWLIMLDISDVMPLFDMRLKMLRPIMFEYSCCSIPIKFLSLMLDILCMSWVS